MNDALAYRPSASAATPRSFTQTLALIVDAYREVNSRKLFWITLLLSLLVVAAFAFVGINQRGIVIFGWEVPGVFNTTVIPADQFYKFIFTEIAIPYWLGFLAAILALVSVCGMFPDLLSGGSIDLYLAKPISRLRLFLTKYVLGLTFAAMQVSVFSIASFLVIGIRGGSWEWKIFLAIPLVTLFFSYLFCVCVLVGVVTRSALAALLTTLLFWGFLFALNSTDAGLMAFKALKEEQADVQRRVVAYNDELIANNNAQPPEKRSDASAFEFQREVQAKRLVEIDQDVSDLRWWYGLVNAVRWPMPKTGETVALMSRWLVDPSPFQQAEEQRQQERERRRASRGRPPRQGADAVDMGDPEVRDRLQDELLSRTTAKIIGTSLLFEGFVLGLAVLVFCRRDF